MATEQEVCGVCKGDKASHEGKVHKFSPSGELIEQKPIPRQAVASGIDIVLRLILIEKGLITMDDIVVKEEQLRHDLHQAVSKSGDGQ